MKIKFFFLAVFLATSLSMPAQTLFSYGNKKVGVEEFVRAYNKINPDPVSNKEKSIRDYLVLYINSRLKIEEAYERRYDTAATFNEELNTLRQQVMDAYMIDPESYNAMLNEAFDRSQKDLLVQHIFIPYTVQNNTSDSAVAKLKIQEANMELISGKNFDDVAMKFSADPSVTQNKGIIGYITVFTLPYEFENIVYNLSPGKFSAPYKSKSGYHIFKVVDSRKAVGKIKLAQILLATPTGSTQEEITKNGKLADSLYQRLLKGDNIARLAAAFSSDYVSAASGGQIPEFGVGTYDPVFEKAAFSLTANGAVSKPFITSHGYHIIKRISLTSPPAIKNKKSLEEIKAQLEKDRRVDIARDLLYNRIISKASVKMADISQQQLQTYNDSIFELKPLKLPLSINNQTTFLTIGNMTKTVGDLMGFAQTDRWLPNGTGVKPLATVVDDFKHQAVFEYYRMHMEEFNPDFKSQMNDLKDGNLFFDIMMKEVWSKAQNDTVGQINYYNQNKNKYKWIKSAGAIMFYCGDEATAQNLRNAIVQSPANWRAIADNYTDKATVDSGRYELTKIPGLKKMMPKPGMITPIEKNKDDNSASFAYVLTFFTTPAQKSFTEAKGDVITDYQNEIESKWSADLKEKYDVKVNEEVLKTILK